ncbi:hypothetical protein ARMSODRAFT_202816 [Armillaria solidipes]|uniref:Uncharacterized protein n=1 Tax=Armillaria solidipes TaxID=1076256 RepID=A0A2H3BWY6_9AGAR|nr:hypothetical protein ARMSODRAFT_202816 [Armillaria solidipes]
MRMLFEWTRAPQRQHFTPLRNEKNFEQPTLYSWYARHVEIPRTCFKFASDSVYLSVGGRRKSRCTGRSRRSRSGFQLALVTIGWFMTTIHCAPQDRVRTFEDVRTRKAVVMHWTWISRLWSHQRG